MNLPQGKQQDRELLNETKQFENDKEESTTKTEIEDITMNEIIKKLLRLKEGKDTSINTEETKSNQEKEIKELHQLLTGAREVILNIEDE